MSAILELLNIANLTFFLRQIHHSKQPYHVVSVIFNTLVYGMLMSIFSKMLKLYIGMLEIHKRYVSMYLQLLHLY
jgi:hypothetical protein